MRLQQLLSGITAMGGSFGNPDISGISCDSRNVSAGELFFAIPGLESDGHDYIRQAALKGAAAVVCRCAPRLSIPVIEVANPRRALAQAAANFYGHPAKQLTLLGVTGTNGKTTTTYLLKTVLERLLHTKVGIIGTNSHRRTTPESLDLHRILRRMADEGCTHVVMEVSSHALVLERVHGVHFHSGIFTNLTQDHLDFHGSMEAYACAKAKLFSQCTHGVFNSGDAYGCNLSKVVDCRVKTFCARCDSADYMAQDIALRPDGVRFLALHRGESCPVELPIPGGFTVENALGVIAAACTLDLPFPEVCAALRHCAAVKGRLEPVRWAGEGSVLIDYAHTPDALENVLSGLRPFTQGRLLCLFGCGGDRDKSKRPRMGAIAARHADLIFLSSDNPRSEEPMDIICDILAGMPDFDAPVIVEADRRKAIALALSELRAGDILLLAGKGHETYQERCGERLPFDERELVENYAVL